MCDLSLAASYLNFLDLVPAQNNIRDDLSSVDVHGGQKTGLRPQSSHLRFRQLPTCHPPINPGLFGLTTLCDITGVILRAYSGALPFSSLNRQSPGHFRLTEHEFCKVTSRVPR